MGAEENEEVEEKTTHKRKTEEQLIPTGSVKKKMKIFEYFRDSTPQPNKLPPGTSQARGLI